MCFLRFTKGTSLKEVDCLVFKAIIIFFVFSPTMSLGAAFNLMCSGADERLVSKIESHFEKQMSEVSGADVMKRVCTSSSLSTIPTMINNMYLHGIWIDCSRPCPFKVFQTKIKEKIPENSKTCDRSIVF